MKFRIVCIIILLSLIQPGCKKQSIDLPLSSLNVVNAVVGTPSIKTNYFGKSINWNANAGTIYGASTMYGVKPGALPVTIVSAADTLHPLFTGTVDLLSYQPYTLFVSGQFPRADTVLIKEEFPSHDSTCGVRFINLSPNSIPLSINLMSNPAMPEHSALAYKQITVFKKYAATKTITSYVFQVRDAGSGNLLSSYTLTSPFPYYHNVTLVIKGLQGTTTGSDAFGIFRVNNY